MPRNTKMPRDRPRDAQPAAPSCSPSPATLHLFLATWWAGIATALSLSNSICVLAGCLKSRILLPWEL